MKTVEQLITELSNFPGDKEVIFLDADLYILTITEYDQDDDGNPTFFLEVRK